MPRDPRQIVTPYAFQVHPELLGLPLATPKRRLAALLIDLVVASVFASLGNTILAAGVSALFFWVAIRTRGKNSLYNFFRFGGAALASILVFGIALGIIEGFDTNEEKKPPVEIEGISTSNDVDVNFMDLGKGFASIDYSNADSIEVQMERMVSEMGLIPEETSSIDFLSDVPEEFITQLTAFQSAINRKDSLATDSLRAELAPVIASFEIEILDEKNEKLDDRNDELRDEVSELRDQIENPSLYKTLKTWFGFMGVSLGWIGIYFIASVAYFKGQTLGKHFLKIRIVRLNNKPVGFFFAFERFGGYAAGIATGLIGFFQMFWDANRQAIHDKIAGTVVIDLRESKIRKTESYRKEILQGNDSPEETEE